MNYKINYVPTVCPYCACGCGIYLVIKNGEIAGIEPMKDHPVNEGTNCPKGKNAYKFLTSEDRLKTPLIKKNGSFKEISWEDVLALIAKGLKGKPSDDIGFINSGRTTNEDLYIMQKFARCVTKTNNIDNCSRFCHSTTVPALLSTVGSGAISNSIVNLDKADCIFIAGPNIQETYPMITRRVIRAKRNGAKVIVVDPRRTITMRNYSDISLLIRPGTDTALINAMMKIIINEGLTDKEFIEKRTKDFDKLKDYLSSLNLEEAEKITDIPIDKLKEAAIPYAKAKSASIIFNAGIAQHVGGIENIKALSDLALMTGNYGRPGTGVNPLRGQTNGEGFGDMGPVPVFYPGFRKVSEETAKVFEDMWGIKGLPSRPGMSYMDMLENCKILYIMGANPMVSAPDINRVKKILEEKELLIVQDIFMTETAKIADIVLPAASWVEKDGTITGVERRVQRINKAIDPPGETRADWMIICKLAEIMGFKEKFNYKEPSEIFQEIRNCVPQYKGITYERLNKPGGIQWPCPSEGHPGTEFLFGEKFATTDGLGHFQIAEYKEPPEIPDSEYPYILTNGRVIFHFHTGSMTKRTNKLNEEVKEAFAEINPEDAKELGIKEGDKIVLKSRRGEVKTVAKLTENIKKGVIFMPWHFSESAPNVLTGPIAGPPSRMPEFKFCPVKLERITK